MSLSLESNMHGKNVMHGMSCICHDMLSNIGLSNISWAYTRVFLGRFKQELSLKLFHVVGHCTGDLVLVFKISRKFC